MKKILIICVSIFLSIGVFFFNQRYYKLEAEEAINPTFIGKIALTQPVLSEEKVYINLSDKAFVESTGRVVYSETNTGGGINFPDPGFPEPGIKPFDFSFNPIVKYYYYAHPNGFDKIIQIVDLYNDIDSLNTVLDILEQRADEFNLTGSDKINAILGYIRSINLGYTDFKWGLFMGSINMEYINYVNSFNNCGIKPNEYFASYISNSLYNVELHGAKRSEYSANSLFLIDPLNGNGQIDLIHLFAVMDGAYNDTGGDNFIINGPISNGKTNRDVCSWLGDIMTGCYDIKTQNNSILAIQTFEQFINQAPSCSMMDILSDIDGISIAVQYLNNNYSIKSSLYNFYKLNVTTWKRRTTFKDSVADDYVDPDFDMFYLFESKIYFAFGLNLGADLQVYELYDLWYYIKETLLLNWSYGTLSNLSLSVSERIHLANLFIEFIDIL